MIRRLIRALLGHKTSDNPREQDLRSRAGTVAGIAHEKASEIRESGLRVEYRKVDSRLRRT